MHKTFVNQTMAIKYQKIFPYTKIQIDLGVRNRQNLGQFINCRVLQYQQMTNEEAQIENNIIYLSAGFDGPFILQAFSVRKLPLPAIGLQMCLTDGKVYIGGKYICATECPELQDYWLVQITAKFVSQTQPILIKTLNIVSTYPRKLLGSPPCTLTDHFNKQINRSNQQKLSEPTKKIKFSNTYDRPLLKNPDYKKPAQKQKPFTQFTSIPPNIYKKREDPKPKIQSDKKQKQKKLKISDSDEQQEYPRQKKQSNGIPKKQQEQDNENGEQKEQQKQGEIFKNTMISNLKERRVGWIILCRVNYLNRVQCNTGLFANNFTLTDEDGDEIKGVYFQNPLDGQTVSLETGKYYSFSNGQISNCTNKKDGQRQLQINFDKNSTIILRENIEFQLNLAKFCRIADIVSKQAFSEINVVGIIKSIKQVYNKGNKLKYSSTICDPITCDQIDLVLFLNEHQQPPSKGAIGFLRNYELYKVNYICRLNSNYKSYFSEETKFKDRVTAQFKKIKEEKDWQNMHYRNLSSVPFVFRTIHELKEAFTHTDDDKIYSFIDCWILDIGKKKFYYACQHCKKQTDKKDSGVYYCPNCRRNVESFYCHTLNVNFADCTSNISIDVIGEHADTLLQMSSQSFHDLSYDKQLAHLNCLRSKNVTLKLKTQKKDDQRKQSHSVWGIENSSPMNTLKQIRRRIQNNNIKINDEW